MLPFCSAPGLAGLGAATAGTALFSAAAEDNAGGSETSALPMAARGCRLSEPARAGFQPFTQNSRHAKRTAIPPERAATRANLEYRSLGIGSSITGVHVAAYYTAAHGASSGQRRFGLFFGCLCPSSTWCRAPFLNKGLQGIAAHTYQRQLCRPQAAKLHRHCCKSQYGAGCA